MRLHLRALLGLPPLATPTRSRRNLVAAVAVKTPEGAVAVPPRRTVASSSERIALSTHPTTARGYMEQASRNRASLICPQALATTREAEEATKVTRLSIVTTKEACAAQMESLWGSLAATPTVGAGTTSRSQLLVAATTQEVRARVRVCPSDPTTMTATMPGRRKTPGDPARSMRRATTAACASMQARPTGLMVIAAPASIMPRKTGIATPARTTTILAEAATAETTLKRMRALTRARPTSVMVIAAKASTMPRKIGIATPARTITILAEAATVGTTPKKMGVATPALTTSPLTEAAAGTTTKKTCDSMRAGPFGFPVAAATRPTGLVGSPVCSRRRLVAAKPMAVASPRSQRIAVFSYPMLLELRPSPKAKAVSRRIRQDTRSESPTWALMASAIETGTLWASQLTRAQKIGAGPPQSLPNLRTRWTC
mmetsp:Transcript_42487/g.117230  ORF Transcript_42487/g.117230 Transcript_42487/m.117230 type:complete len:429 (+) Transcript_42487:1777-3063(+)